MEPKPIVELHSHIIFRHPTVQKLRLSKWYSQTCVQWSALGNGKVSVIYSVTDIYISTLQKIECNWKFGGSCSVTTIHLVTALYRAISYTGLTVFLAKTICCLSLKFDDKIFCFTQTFLTSDNHLQDVENIRTVLCKSFIQWFWELNLYSYKYPVDCFDLLC